MDMMGMGMMDMGMGAMDMGMGMDMMGMGAMDMGMGMGMMGAMDMGMGMGMMEMGAMDMGMGMGMGMGGMGMGMGMGIGMAGGMGMGMGRRIGYCQPGCNMSCCRTVVICPSNCTNTCCTTRRVIQCPPGCARNCCINNNFNDNIGFMRSPPPLRNPQMYNNMNNLNGQNFINIPPSRNNPNMMMNQTPNSNLNDVEQQKIIEEQIRIENEKRKQVVQKQMLEKEQLMMNQQNLQLKQKQIQQQKLNQQVQLKLQQQTLQQAKQSIQNQNLQNQNQNPNTQMMIEKNVQKDLNSVDPTNNGNNPYMQYQQILHQGDVYQKTYGNWKLINAGRLTVDRFLTFKIQNINKIKVKHASQIPNTRLVKLSMNTEGDVFFSMMNHAQIECSCRIIWAKLASMGIICNINDSFNMHLQGKVLKKSLFGRWQEKLCMISGQGLRYSNFPEAIVTHTINSFPEVWTRFEIMQGNFLVIKMMNGVRKHEIGIPIEHAMSWLRGFFSLVRL